jgi:hypothetical protein
MYGITAFKLQVDGQHTEILYSIVYFVSIDHCYMIDTSPVFMRCFEAFANIAYPFLACRCQNRTRKQVN